VATARWRPAHQWFLLEARAHRIQRTLSVKQGNAFVKRVLAQPKLWLIGNDGDLAT